MQLHSQVADMRFLGECINLGFQLRWPADVDVCFDVRELRLLTALDSTGIVSCSPAAHLGQVESSKLDFDLRHGELRQRRVYRAVHTDTRGSIVENTSPVTALQVRVHVDAAIPVCRIFNQL